MIGASSWHKEEIGSGEVERAGAWYALHTRFQHEKSAARVLENRGLEVFLPLYSAVHVWKDRKMEVSLPLFPCYLFLRGGLERRLDVVTAPGVLNWVAIGGRPAAIEQNEIEALQRAVANAVRMEPHEYLRTGDRVRVTSGSLAGVQGILIRKKKQYRLILSIEMLGKSAAVEIDGQAVERVKETSSVALAQTAQPQAQVAGA